MLRKDEPPWLASLMSLFSQASLFSPMLESVFCPELLTVVGIFLEYPALPRQGSWGAYLPPFNEF